MVANFLGSAFGGLFGAGASALSSLQQYQYQKALQKQAAQLNYDYGQKSLLNSPLSTRQGLEKAGYNPMLAVQNSTTGANSGWTSAGNATGTDYASGISQAVNNAQNLRRLENETAQTQSAVDTNEATARNQNAEARNRELENEYIPENYKKQFAKIDVETAKLARETDYYDELVDLREKQLKLDQYGIDVGAFTARRGQDIGYAGTVYNANSSASASRYASDVNAETQRGMRTDKLPFGIGSTYYDMRHKDSRMRVKDANDRKYWREYY